MDSIRKLKARIIRETEKGLLLYISSYQEQMWIPKSVLKEMYDIESIEEQVFLIEDWFFEKHIKHFKTIPYSKNKKITNWI